MRYCTKCVQFIIPTPKGKRIIGPGQPVFIIAEMSCNHNQDFNRALKIIDAAAEAGADAVKLQTYTADTVTIDSDKEWFQLKKSKIWKGQTLYQLYQKAYTPWEWHPRLKEYGESKGLVVFSFPLDASAVDFLESMGVALYKIGSPEIVDIPLLKKVGQTKKPVIMSVGMASLEEIELALKTLRENGCSQVALLYCVSSYPTVPEQLNLSTIPALAQRFKVITGFSGHTLSIAPAIASVALGAKIIEKHLTLRRSDGGLDATFSLEPAEFKEMVKTIKEVEKAVGKPTYGGGEARQLRRSLFVVKDIKKGERLTNENVRSIRPGYGLTPKYLDDIIGKTAVIDIEKGRPLSWDLIKTVQDNYLVRPVQKGDSRDIWQIRNHPLVRENSLNPQIIPLKEHKEWFEKKYFGNEDNHCFVLQNNKDEVIGYCRFDFSSKEDAYIISIALNPQYHRKGLGNYLLNNSLKSLASSKDVLVVTKKNNIPSIKLFQKNNFRIYKEDLQNYYLKYK